MPMVRGFLVLMLGVAVRDWSEEMALRSVRRALVVAAGLAALMSAPTVACAQLRPSEVLVVYDSRIPESAEVARIYAGSAKVPGGSTFEPGFRPGVRVLDINNTTAPLNGPGDITFTDYVTRMRTPIRNHLTSTGLVRTIRCIVLCKGMPHRLRDSDVALVGDDAGAMVTEINASDVTCASVDSELAVLWQDLTTGEMGGANDSLADGLIANPYWRARLPISTFTTVNIQAAKTYTNSFPGPTREIGSATGAARLTAGDIYLVTRLDAPTVADVRAMLTKARGVVYDVDQHAILLDASGSNNVADAAPNTELDNSGGPPFAAIYGGDDYERTRDQVLADGRFLPARVIYDQFGGQFYVGPRVAYTGATNVLTQPVALLATFGANHGGTYPVGPGGSSASNTYADSFNYANGAIFNTVESYNGRAFGGLSAGGTNQEQASDFLAAGGTFALGMVWEPFAATIPDNEQLTANFLAGSMTWAEAAWSSIPCLSWMHIVLGDPLAQPWRTSEDQQANGVATIDDLAVWERRPSNDPLKNINRTGVADNTDRLLLLRSLRFGERGDLINRRP